MIIFLHVSLALLGLTLSGLAWAMASQKLLISAYASILGALASGVYLSFHYRTHLLSVCLSGLFYILIVSAELLLARHRLAAASRS